MEYFYFRKVSRDDPLMEEIFRLRYKVYIDEWGFEKPEDHPDGLEHDSFDDNSVHFAAIDRKQGKLIGTVRIILESPRGFPIQHHCTIDQELQRRVAAKTPDVSRSRYGEISRLAVSKDYRRRSLDDLILDGQYYDDVERLIAQREANIAEAGYVSVERRRQQDTAIVMGLYRCLCMASRELQLTHWYVVMARGLHVLLKRTGFFFEPIGPEKEYHGIRRPYLGYLQETLRGIPELYQLYTGEGL